MLSRRFWKTATQSIHTSSMAGGKIPASPRTFSKPIGWYLKIRCWPKRELSNPVRRLRDGSTSTRPRRSKLVQPFAVQFQLPKTVSSGPARMSVHTRRSAQTQLLKAFISKTASSSVNQRSRPAVRSSIACLDAVQTSKVLQTVFPRADGSSSAKTHSSNSNHANYHTLL